MLIDKTKAPGCIISSYVLDITRERIKARMERIYIFFGLLSESFERTSKVLSHHRRFFLERRMEWSKGMGENE